MNPSREQHLLGQIAQGDRRAIPQILKALDDAESNVRWHPAEGLGQLGAQEAADALVKHLRDPNDLVRGSCARSLGQLRHAPAVPHLRAAMSDDSGFVTYWATWALGEIGGSEAAEALLSDAANVQGGWFFYIRRGERRALSRMRGLLATGDAVQNEAEWAVGSGEPPLEKAALAWGRRNHVKVHPKRKPLLWGQPAAADNPAASAAQDAEWLKKLDASGWLDDVPPREARRIKAAVRRDERSGAAVLSPAGFDAECIEDSGDYRKWVLSSYQKASAGQLTFSRVKDIVDHDKQIATVSFSIGRKAFRRTFPQPDDYIADGPHEFVNKALAATRHRKRFYLIGTGDQTAALAFVTPRTFARARKLGLV